MVTLQEGSLWSTLSIEILSLFSSNSARPSLIAASNSNSCAMSWSDASPGIRRNTSCASCISDFAAFFVKVTILSVRFSTFKCGEVLRPGDSVTVTITVHVAMRMLELVAVKATV